MHRCVEIILILVELVTWLVHVLTHLVVWFFETDRCVSKYMDSQQLIGEVLRKANEAQVQQQQQMMQMQQQLGG